MNKPRSRQAANDTRPTRRSLVELTAAAASGAGLPATPPTTIAISPGGVPPVEHAAERFDQMARDSLIDLPVAGQATAMIPVSAPEPADAAALNADESEIPGPTDSTTEMAARIARDYQTRVLENMKVSMNAALDYAKGCASTRMPTDAMSNATAEGEEKRRAVACLENNIPTALGAAAEYRAKTCELMKASMDSTLEYARQLVHVRTPSEFVELSSTHARKQFELILRQTNGLRSFAQTVTKPDAT
jgi:hypothetical protein